MHYRILFFPLFIAGLLIVTCDRDFSSLQQETNPFALVKPTSHDFSWEIDTLSYPGAVQIIPTGIWASDANDVWMIAGSDDSSAEIWHWNGVLWKPYDFIGFRIDPTDIIGFAKDNIWVIGNNKQHLVHWDGSNWILVDTAINNRFGMSIWGTSWQDLFLGFDEGLLAHYNGSHFTTYQTDTKAQFVDIFGLDPNNVYACGTQWDEKQPIDSMYYYFFHYDGRKWNLTNRHIQTAGASVVSFPFGSLWGNTRGVLFGINDDKVFSKTGSSNWSPMFDPPETIWKLHATDINNIFIGGYWGNSIYHFNGQNWTNFNRLKSLNYSVWAIFCIKNQVFIAGINSYDRNAYVIRGKRKD